MRKDLTKRLLAEAIKELSKVKNLNKITIKDICDYCECNHSTFYYHFADKDDLIEWIIKTDIEDHFNKVDTEIWTNNTYHLLCTFQKHCAFYRQCLTMNTHNSLPKLINDINQRAITQYLDNRLGSQQISEEARNFFIHFWSAAFSDTNIRYIMDDAATAPEKMLQYYYNFTEPVLDMVIQNFIDTDRSKGMKPISAKE